MFEDLPYCSEVCRRHANELLAGTDDCDADTSLHQAGLSGMRRCQSKLGQLSDLESSLVPVASPFMISSSLPLKNFGREGDDANDCDTSVPSDSETDTSSVDSGSD